MACVICKRSVNPVLVRKQHISPPCYSICEACYSGARIVISSINYLQNNEKPTAGGGGDNKFVNIFSPLPGFPNPSQVFLNCLIRIKEMMDKEEELNDKLTYMAGVAHVFKEEIQTDIQVFPGNNGSPISVHRELLATRSDIFKNMLSSDEIMAPPSDKIALPEFTYEELNCLLEFLYTGQLTEEKLQKHIYSLSIAADKYEIPFLAKSCERQLLKYLNSTNALAMLEISHKCSMQRLKELALNFIVKNMGDIVFSTKFEAFARKNPHLGVEITRASFMDSKSRKRNIH